MRFVKKKTNKLDAVDVWEDERGFEKVEVYESIFTMDNVEQPLRFVKFAMKHKDKNRSQLMIVTTSMDMAHKTLFKIIRARWDIENSIFNNLKIECGLDHCFVHGGKAVEAERAWKSGLVEEFKAYLDARDRKPLDKFDGDLFRKLVEKVRVESMVEVEFFFKVGVVGREILN